MLYFRPVLRGLSYQRPEDPTKTVLGGLITTIKPITVSNLNTIDNSNRFCCFGFTGETQNRPSDMGGMWGWGLQLARGNSSDYVQILIAGYSNKLYFRSRDSGTWTNWYKLTGESV